MANVSRPGSSAIDPDMGWDVAAPFVGRDPALGVPFKQRTEGSLGGQPNVFDPFSFLAASGTRTAAGGGGVGTAPVDRAGVDEAGRTSFAFDWFEHVHVLPRTEIAFGNILGLVEEDYEIFNAFRRSEALEIAISNGASPGVELPNNVPTESLGPLSSLLDPSSTGQTASALGTLVKLKVRALPDGLPTFSAPIVFDFAPPANDVQLVVSGSRIVLVPFEYEQPLAERLRFFTDVTPAIGGKEQRARPRKQPRQSFEPHYRLDGNLRRRFQALLFDWQANQFGFPLWHEALELTTTTGAGATQYPVLDADDVDLRVGGLAAVIQDEVTFDVLRLVAVTPTLVTAADPSQNAYAAGTRLVPLRTARITPRAVRGLRHPVNLAEFQLEYEVTDNDTGAPAGSTTPGWWSTYDGRVLLDDPNFLDAAMPEEYHRNVLEVDGETGLVSQSSRWQKNKRSHEKGFILKSRSEVLAFRLLLLALGGRQKSLWIPTFAEDLEVVADVNSGTNVVDVNAIDYVRFVGERSPMNVFRVTFTDGSQLVREVTASATVSATVERLTLDANWPANRTVAEFERLEFYEPVRFDSDEFLILHERVGRARCRVPLLRVFDHD